MRKNLLFLTLISCSLRLFAQTGGINATKIAETYSNSIVKILLFDSLAEKANPGSGYIGRGSGFIVTDDGIVFTNRHVINFCVNGYIKYDEYNIETKETSTRSGTYSQQTIDNLLVTKVNKTGLPVPIIQVYTGKGNNDYKLYYAKVLMVDTSSFDGAILQIVSDLNGNAVTDKFNPVPIGNSDSTKQGEDLCIYGFPMQYSGNFDLMLSDLSTLTFGKHSGFDYVFNTAYGYIKTDASINSGNSGGPVFNSSNKVIGIATATGNKTGIGLVGGINAMFMVTSPDLALLSKLQKAGLVKPQKYPANNTAKKAVTRNILAGEKNIAKFNKDKKFNRQFLRGAWALKVLYPITNNDEFTMDIVSPMPYKSSPVNFSLKSLPNIEIEKQFVLWRIKKDFKISFDWSILGVMPMNFFELGDVIADSIPDKYQKPMELQVFYTKPGLAVSFLVAKRIFVDCYYKPSIYIVNRKDDFLYYKNSHDSISYQYNIDVNGDSHFRNALGFNVRYNIVSVGMEYVFGKSPLRFTYESDYYVNGGPSNHVGFDIEGYHKSNSLFLTLGFYLSKSTLKKLPIN